MDCRRWLRMFCAEVVQPCVCPSTVSLFPAFENSSLETAKARLESMQIIAKHKRKAAEQAELEVLEAENNVEAIEFEIEVIQRKGQSVSCDGFSGRTNADCAFKFPG